MQIQSALVAKSKSSEAATTATTTASNNTPISTTVPTTRTRMGVRPPAGNPNKTSGD